MTLCWDDAKRERTLRERGLDFARAEEVFAGLTWDFPDEAHSQDEERWITVGWLDGLLVMIVRKEEREGLTRIISMRYATANERKLYVQEVG